MPKRVTSQDASAPLRVNAGNDVLALVIDRLHRRLPAIVDLHAVLGIFLVIMDMSRSAGTLSLAALERVAGPREHFRSHIEALECSGLISIDVDWDSISERHDSLTISDQQLLDVWRQASRGL
ncbi:hypothetical protein [Rhizobium sp. PP-F2F-G48]|uniref:hypothetical protein n=1 Tax=Rhizobium sp. PP-F2F-G48 TaxID=2135651 RepID=UPI001049F181|nr:hypothetical protein [Rhizobium sp. PP-F2F-G48]